MVSEEEYHKYIPKNKCWVCGKMIEENDEELMIREDHYPNINNAMFIMYYHRPCYNDLPDIIYREGPNGSHTPIRCFCGKDVEVERK